MARSVLRTAWLLVGLLLVATVATAATEYSVADGLSQNSALALARDDDGFLWIGTEDGLNRFDGYEFRVYRPADQAPAAIAAAYIKDIAAAGRYLFLATNGGGLAVFDRVDERFRTLGVVDGMPADHLNRLAYLAPGELYVGTRNGLVRLHWQGDPMTAAMQITPVVVGGDRPRSEFWELEQGPSGLWIGTGDGVFRVDAAGQVSETAVVGTTRPFNIDALLEAPAGVLWVGSWNQGLFRIDLSSAQTRHFIPDAADTPGMRSARILELAAGPDGSVYIGTDRGLTWYDPGCDCIKALDQRRSARVAGRGFLVQALQVDARGGVFAGFWGEGLVRFTPSDRVFHVEQKRDEGPEGLNHSRVRALLEDRHGDLWVGSFGGGVQRIVEADRSDGAPWRFESLPFPAGAPPEARLVWSLLEDRAGHYWAATDDGLYERAPDARDWTREQPIGSELAMPGTRCLLEDSRGRIWVGSSNGLGRIDARGEPRREIDFLGSVPAEPVYRPQDLNIFALFQDTSERLWVGTWAGLHILDADGRSLAHYRIADGLPGPIVWDIHRHSDGSLWLATNGGLTRVIDPEAITALKFESLSNRAGFPRGTIYGIASDRAGQLWLTGNQGLIRLDPVRGSFHVWRSSDGIAADEFAAGAMTVGAQGRLYIGGVGGLTAVDPVQLHTQTERPNPRLASAVLGDRRVRLDAGPERTPTITLDAQHPPLILDFTGLIYDTPAAAQYAYRLDRQADFTVLGARRSLILDRLPIGTHRLELKVDNQGSSTARPLLRLDVSPPYYLTWTFRIAVVAAAALALSLLYVWRIGALTRLRRRLEVEVSTRTRELRNQKEALEATAEALAVANAKLKTLSAIDPLTGLPNRRELIERIGVALRVPGAPSVALAVIDLDQFKRVNDSHGHLAGDAVLRDFAEVMQAQAQRGDAVGRWGGEEFIALIADADAESAQGWADELLARVRSRRVATAGGQIGYRISVGVAVAAAGDDMDALVARADRALYAAKNGGRDRAVMG